MAACPGVLGRPLGRDGDGGGSLADSLYGRITGRGGEGDWEYDVGVTDYGVEAEIPDDVVVEALVGPADFDLYASVRFPRADIPLLFQQLRRRR